MTTTVFPAASDIAWLAEHGPEIDREYAGRWVAVFNGRIIGVGDTAVEAAEQARRVCSPGEYILHAVDANADAIYGGI